MYFQNYFKEKWNMFDFITVVGSIVDATKETNQIKIDNPSVQLVRGWAVCTILSAGSGTVSTRPSEIKH